MRLGSFVIETRVFWRYSRRVHFQRSYIKARHLSRNCAAYTHCMIYSNTDRMASTSTDVISGKVERIKSEVRL